MREIQSINPVNQEIVGRVPVTEVDAIPEALNRSSLEQKKWAEKSLQERGDILRPVVEKIRAEKEALATLMTKEMGKPIKASMGEVGACASVIEREIPEMVKALSSEKKDHAKMTETVFFDPIGVSVAITPWNFPMLMPVWQILPSLMAGNSVIFKPSEETPLIAQALADLFIQVLPEDVLIVVHGDGEQGRALVAAKETRLITFTGSRTAGLHILRAASEQLKRVILELGGKDPLVVLKSADIPSAVKFAVGNGFRNSGQVCVSTERVYIDQSVFADFNLELKRQVENLTVGDGLVDGIDMGPMVNEKQKSLVEKQLQEAVAAGAKVLVQGQDGGDLKAKGQFVPPTVLTDVDHKMSVMKDETFGPVLGVMPFQSEEEAVDLANDTPYGLGAAVFGEESEAERIAARLQSGMVGINKGVSGTPNSPWVGAKESGYGFHSSEMGHRQFAQVRVVTRAK